MPTPSKSTSSSPWQKERERERETFFGRESEHPVISSGGQRDPTSFSLQQSQAFAALGITRAPEALDSKHLGAKKKQAKAERPTRKNRDGRDKTLASLRCEGLKILPEFLSDGLGGFFPVQSIALWNTE